MTPIIVATVAAPRMGLPVKAEITSPMETEAAWTSLATIVPTVVSLPSERVRGVRSREHEVKHHTLMMGSNILCISFHSGPRPDVEASHKRSAQGCCRLNLPVIPGLHHILHEPSTYTREPSLTRFPSILHFAYPIISEIASLPATFARKAGSDLYSSVFMSAVICSMLS